MNEDDYIGIPWISLRELVPLTLAFIVAYFVGYFYASSEYSECCYYLSLQSKERAVCMDENVELRERLQLLKGEIQ